MNFEQKISSSLKKLIQEGASALQARFVLSEAIDSTRAPWIDPYAANYNRGYAEDILHNTINPLDDSATYTKQWSSKLFEPPPGYEPGGPAPKFTPEQFMIAVAGDPTVAITGQARTDQEKNRSPRNPGSYGSAPIYRMAKAIAAKGARQGSWEDLYSLGLTALSQLIRPGMDKGAPPFIKRLLIDARQAMLNGLGGTVETMAAVGKQSQAHKSSPYYNIRGLQSILDNPTAEQARIVTSQVKPPYDTERSNDRNIENPFGWYSVDIVQACQKVMQATDENQMQQALQNIKELQDRIDIFNSASAKGATTGLLSTIDTPDRKTRIKMGSLDKPITGSEGQATSQAGNVPGREESPEIGLDPSMVGDMIELMIYGYRDIIQGTNLVEILKSKGLPVGEGTFDTTKIKDTEYRILLRILGHNAGNYPGKGKPRGNIDTPRGTQGWYVIGQDDPEIEPLLDSQTWESPWLRNQMPVLNLDGIRKSLALEDQEMAELASAGKVKAPSKVSVSNILSRNRYSDTMAKLTAVALILKSKVEQTGENAENAKHLQSQQRAYAELFEGLDQIDRKIISESLGKFVHELEKARMQSVLSESKLLRNFI